MFKKSILFCWGGILLCCSQFSFAQTTVTLDAGKDAYIRIQQGSNTWADFNYVNSNLLTYMWTHGGIPTKSRNLINFNCFSQIPEGSTILDARLHFRCATNDPYFFRHNMEGPNNNSMYIRRVLSPWVDNTVTWNTQPTVTTTNETTLASTPGNSTQDYLNIDVTGMVQDMFTTNTFYGFQLALQDESYYDASHPRKDMNFGSFDNVNPALRPTLVITYDCPGCCPTSNILTSDLIAPAGNPTYEVGETATYTFRFSNSSCAPILNFDIAPTSFPYGFSSIEKRVGGIITNGTFTIPANGNAEVEISGVYTASSDPILFTHDFAFGGDVCTNTSGTFSKTNIKTTLPMPLNFLLFEGQSTETGNLLTWHTSEEENTNLFRVLHSEDGVHFKAIGTVQAGGQADLNYYQFSDPAVSGRAYYKIEEVDLDGRRFYSETIVLTSVQRMSVYPNPAEGVVNIEFPLPAKFTVCDVTGRLVYSGKAQKTELHLESGMYIVQCENGWVEKLIVR